MNNVNLTGRLTKDVDIRYTSSNKAVASFTIAVDKFVNGEKQADFINCVVWEKQAENLNRFCRKGSKVAIEGCIQTRTYDAKDGTKRNIVEVLAHNIEYLDNKPQGVKETPQEEVIIDIPPDDLPF